MYVFMIVAGLFTLSFVMLFLIPTLPSVFISTLRGTALTLMHLYDMPVFFAAGTVILGVDVVNWITIVISVTCIVAGILGAVYRKKPERMKICVKFGFAVMTLELIVYVVTLALFEMNLMRVMGWSLVFLVSLLAPGIYTYEAYKFRDRS